MKNFRMLIAKPQFCGSVIKQHRTNAPLSNFGAVGNLRSHIMAAGQILLLRVGMDLGYGGLGPIFSDGSFEYVPIPENPKKTSSRSLLFSQIPARYGGFLDQFAPTRYRGGTAHYDPEFETFTYGDPTKNKRGQLLRLRLGISLFFTPVCARRVSEADRGFT